ncbi:MAG TPA: Mur ligase family protein, partial [Thermomicrobiales bacterium]|nr:Mur ligase family protein [Thermomicrobiales bacterium]
MHLGQLVGQLPVTLSASEQAVDITSLEYDSRLVRPGSLFVALRGGYADGHNFGAQAVQQGAGALIVEEYLPLDVPQIVVADTRETLATVAATYHGNPSRELVVIGITGTDGKTTTSYILDHILRSVGLTTGMIGTVSVRIADETIDHETRQTTPESAEIQHLLRQMADANVTHAILEATSHGLDLHRLDHVEFQIGVVTNITHEHLEHHKTIENYWAAKARLFREVGRNHGQAVVNLDDPGARSVIPASEGCERIWTYSLHDQSADIWAKIEQSEL